MATGSAAGDVVLETSHGGGQIYRYEDDRCEIARRGPFEQLACPSFAALLHDQSPLLVSLVLANARALAADFGAPPILLLDEVAAHLDAGRRAALP